MPSRATHKPDGERSHAVDAAREGGDPALAALLHALDALAEGELTVRLPSVGTSPLHAALAEAFNRVAARHASMVSEVIASATAVADGRYDRRIAGELDGQPLRG